MTDRDWIIWAAGFFDGEGCVSISKIADYRKRKPYLSYQLSIIVVQKQSEVLGRLKEMFGGFITNQISRGRHYGKWVCNSTEAMNALSRMLPYLVVKRPVAEVGIQFQEVIHRQRKAAGFWGKRGVRSATEDELAEREMLHLLAKSLNSGSQSPFVGNLKDSASTKMTIVN